MSKSGLDPEAVLAAMAPALGLDIRAEWRAGVLGNLATLANVAAQFVDFPLDDVHDEPAPVFRPGSAQAEGGKR